MVNVFLKRAQKGFTLIELLVVISIIGLLASIVVVSLSGARSGGRDAKRLADLRQVQNAMELCMNNLTCSQAAIYDYPSGAAAADTDTCSEIGAILSAAGVITTMPSDPGGSTPYACFSLANSYCLSSDPEAGTSFTRISDSGVNTAATAHCVTATDN